MRKFILALALSAGATSTVVAPFGVMAAKIQHQSLYTGFFYGLENDPDFNLKLASLIERSLHKDATGMTKLDAHKCATDGSCATPVNYLESARAHDPEAVAEGRLNDVSQLPAFFRSLTRVCNIQGDFKMDRISRATGKADINGMHRFFRKGECALVDKRRVILAFHCANPVGYRIDLACVVDNIPVRSVNERLLTWERTVRPTDACSAVRFVTHVEELDDGKGWVPLKPGCIGKVCSFDQFNRRYGYTTKAQGQVELLGGAGFVQVRHAPDEVPAYCVKSVDLNADGTLRFEGGAPVIINSSFTNGTHFPMDFREVAPGQWHSRIFYRLAELPAGTQMNDPKGLFLYVDNQQEIDRVYSRMPAPK